MKLRSQMLLAGMLTLAVPLVGWQSVKQLYSALQQNRTDEQILKVANLRLTLSEARTVKQVLVDSQETTGEKDWYAQSSPYPIFVDGYADDWQELAADTYQYQLDVSEGASNDDLDVFVRVARRDDNLFLFVRVQDDRVVYHTPPLLRADAGEDEMPDLQTLLVNGDSIELLIRDSDNNWQHGLFRAIAPGPLPALQATAYDSDGRGYQNIERIMPQWQAAWVAETDGYHLEAQLPLPESGSRIGLAVVDVDHVGDKREKWAGSLSPADMQVVFELGLDAEPVSSGMLFHDNLNAQAYLNRWTPPGVRTRLYDVHGRMLADVNNLYVQDVSDAVTDPSRESSDGLWDAILLRVFAFFVAGDLPLLSETRKTPASLDLSDQRRASVLGDAPVTSRYVTEENDRVLGTLAPISSDPRLGYLLFEANEEHASAYAGSQLARLFSLLLLVSLLAGSGLLIFAFVLSSRISHLSREAQFAIADDGRVRGLPGSDARDEIGDLSRKLSSLLSRSAAYTHYLEALSGRLSHELRTPLSVVRTSIENLDRDALDEKSRQLVDRASDGAEHLGSIIKALVESTRLEQSVQLADRQRVNLAEWLEGSQLRYQQVYPDVVFRVSPYPLPVVYTLASPELLQQAFDKLVDNAVSFATGGPIVLHMSLVRQSSPAKVSLGVANQGVQVSSAGLAHWFEPLYSEREAGSEEMHLGLGLYIVKMIAESHGGVAFARNQQTADKACWVHVGLELTAT